MKPQKLSLPASKINEVQQLSARFVQRTTCPATSGCDVRPRHSEASPVERNRPRRLVEPDFHTIG